MWCVVVGLGGNLQLANPAKTDPLSSHTRKQVPIPPALMATAPLATALMANQKSLTL